MRPIKKAMIYLYEKLYSILRWKTLLYKYRFKVLSSEETLKTIRDTKCSIARFGDGEFGLILQTNHPDFQAPDSALSQRLIEIAKYTEKDVLVCIPHNFKGLDDCNDFAWKFWNWWLWDNNNLENCAIILGLNRQNTRIFGDAQLTRPYMDWKDKSRAEGIFNGLKSLWKDKRVLLIEGSETKMGINNDLLSEASDVKRIICPSRNAFDKYDEILNCVIDYVESNENVDIVLICLGPAATVLAYDLGRRGYQALDIGHIDIEYEWFLKKSDSKTAVTGKYTQEAHNRTDESLEDNIEYRSQIVMRIM